MDTKYGTPWHVQGDGWRQWNWSWRHWFVIWVCETEYSDIEDFESKAQSWKVFPQQKECEVAKKLRSSKKVKLS